MNRRILIIALAAIILLAGVLNGFNSNALVSNEDAKAVRVVIPAFPTAARYSKASGSSIVTISINQRGQVESARFKEGHPLFSLISERAARQWVFEPSTEDKSRLIEIEFKFILIGSDSDDDETSTFVSPNVVEIKGKAAVVNLERKNSSKVSQQRCNACNREILDEL